MCVLILGSELLGECLPGALQLPIIRAPMNEYSIAPHPKVRSAISLETPS